MVDTLTGTRSGADRPGHWYRVNHDETVSRTPRTVQALHNEHAYMFNLLDSLDEQVALITAGRDADFNLLLDIVDYLQNFPERFHHPKEDLIYQRMALRDGEFAREVIALLDEHKVLKKLINRLADAINDVHVMPTVLKKQLAGDLCAQYEARLREHINTEEARILPRAVEVLREEDWFLIDQQSTPINEIPIDNILTDNYTAARRLFKGKTEQLANNVVLAEYLGSHSLLEFLGGLGVTVNYGAEAYKHGVSEGWSAYKQALKSWLPRSATDSEQRFRNPVQLSWQAFRRGMADAERPDAQLFEPLQRALALYATLIGGRGKPVDKPAARDEPELDPGSMKFLEEIGTLLQ